MITDNEVIQSFCKVSYDILETKDEIKKMLIEEQLPILQVQLERKIQLECLRSKLFHLYYRLLNNKIYLKINQKSIETLKVEQKIILEIKRDIPLIKKKDILYLVLQKMECLSKIDEVRLDYIHTNANTGRIVTTNFQLSKIQEYIEQEEQLEKERKV